MNWTRFMGLCPNTGSRDHGNSFTLKPMNHKSCQSSPRSLQCLSAWSLEWFYESIRTTHQLPSSAVYLPGSAQCGLLQKAPRFGLLSLSRNGQSLRGAQQAPNSPESPGPNTDIPIQPDPPTSTTSHRDSNVTMYDIASSCHTILYKQPRTTAHPRPTCSRTLQQCYPFPSQVSPIFKICLQGPQLT